MPELQRRRHSGSVRLYWFVAVSVAVHLSLASLMLLGPRAASIAKPDATPPTLEFRLVQQEGAGPTSAPPPAPAAPPAPSAPPPVQPPLREPPPSDEPAIAAAPATPSATQPPPTPAPVAAPPQTIAAPPAPPAPQINLGGTDSLSSLIATGEQIVPPAIDATIHNREPVYPREAARLGQQGAVTLLVHVAPDGSVAEVEIPQTSGFRMLDEAARDAVASWHFRPAIRNGAGVESRFPVRIQFRLE